MKQPAHTRARIMTVACDLFYQQGLHAVGVDEIVARSGVAKSTLYAHFPSKDHLIVAYLETRSAAWRDAVTALRAGRVEPAAATIDAIFALLAAGCADPAFRGCPFINAAAEFPDPAHPARAVGVAHHAWVHGVFAELAADAGAPDPAGLADALCLLYDAAMTGSQLDGTGAAAKRARQAARFLVANAFNPLAA